MTVEVSWMGDYYLVKHRVNEIIICQKTSRSAYVENSFTFSFDIFLSCLQFQHASRGFVISRMVKYTMCQERVHACIFVVSDRKLVSLIEWLDASSEWSNLASNLGVKDSGIFSSEQF